MDKKKNMYKTIFFDFDGTLFDTSNGIVDCLNWTIKKVGRNKAINKINKNVIGPSADIIFKNLFPDETDKFIDEVVLLFRQKYVKDGIFKAKPFKGTIKMLLGLKKNDKKIGIISNKPKIYILKILNNYNIVGLFDYINAPKLNKKGYSKNEELKKIIKKHRLMNNECIFIGDRTDDIIIAKTNKITSVGITYGFGAKEELVDSGADYICNNIIDLKKILIE